MLEMLKERKAALQAEGKKGFTLMEMLIVIAIIAILIAIAIPLFTSQLNAAKEATDESNARALYAQLQANYMLGSTGSATGAIAANGTTTFTDSDGTVTTYKWSDVVGTGSSYSTSGVPVVTVVTNGHTHTFGTASSSSSGD